jgi:hypothetical protein
MNLLSFNFKYLAIAVPIWSSSTQTTTSLQQAIQLQFFLKTRQSSHSVCPLNSHKPWRNMEH